uniref:Protein kinase domain-containing protein n=1 Tax=Panagrolaimus sp. ES5 TaxID=591445 RepID=A0AC34GTV3_9BILA
MSTHQTTIIEGESGKYKLYYDQILGKGGFATVYMGKNVKTGEFVAIKHVQHKLNYGVKEAQKMKELSDDRENVYTVKLLDYYHSKSSNKLFLVLPYYKHGSLHDYIAKHGKLSIDLVKNVFLQLIKCLKYLHGKQTMHRDLKCENIIVKCDSINEFTILLGDLGLAKTLETGKHRLQTTCGTPGYMPPECKNGNYGIEAEIYSLGGILYYLLTGRSPRPGQEKEQLDRINSGYPEAYDLIQSLWNANPSKRPTLTEIERNLFLNPARKRESSIISLTKKTTPSENCKHRIYQNGYCNRCGQKQPDKKSSRDSAYESKETVATKGRTKTPLYEKNGQGKSAKDLSWPLPSFEYFKPKAHKPEEEFKWAPSSKGRFMIMDSNLIVYEALDSDKNYVKYIFEVKIKDDKQEVFVYKPTNSRQLLPKLEDDPIIEKKYIKKITCFDDLQEYTAYYKHIIKAIATFSSRNAKINFSYVDGIKGYTAKLMYDGSFRFIFYGKCFVQQPEGEIYPTLQSQANSLTAKEKELFITTRKMLLEIDQHRTRRLGKFYPPLNMNEKQSV